MFTKVLWGIMEMMSQGWAFSGTTAAFTLCWLSAAMVPKGTGRRNSDPPRPTHDNHTDEAEGLARGVGGDVTT